MTQLAPDIRKKLQNLGMGPATCIEEILKVTSLVFYTKYQEEEERALGREKYKEKRQAQLIAALQGQKPIIPQYQMN